MKKREKILIVEDEDGVRNLIENVLSGFGYKVYSAENENKAEEIMKTHDKEIALLLTDIILSDKRGTELAKKFRKDFPQLKVLLFLGYPDKV